MRPPGAYLLGEAALDQQQLRDWHRDRVQALQDGGVSFIAIETIPVSRYGEIHYSTTSQYSIKTNTYIVACSIWTGFISPLRSACSPVHTALCLQRCWPYLELVNYWL